MKIVYCLPQLYHPGGIEHVTTLKANYLSDKYGHEITIIATNQQKQNPFFKLSNAIKVIDLSLDYEKTLSMSILKRLIVRHHLHLEHKRKLTLILNELKPDITISTFTHESGFLPTIKDKSKKVLESHFCRGHKRIVAKTFHYPIIKKILFNIRCWQEENLIIPRYDKFIVLTEEDRNLWSTKINNIISIPNILSFTNSSYSPLTAKRAIAVGRLDAQKGFDVLIGMWASIVKECPDWRLDIYGQGEDENKMKKQIHDLNLQTSVFINIPSPQIELCYLQSSLLLMTSRYEGWGMVLTEAMQCGVPAVAFSCKCGPQDIIKDKEDGLCIPINQKELFIKSTINIMKDSELRKTIGEKARKNIQRYSIEKIMPIWNNLFNNLKTK